MSEKPSAVARFVGAAIMAIGVLITLLSGACTGVVLFTSLVPGNRDLSSILLILCVGLPFIAVGVAIFFGGRAISQGGSSRPDR